MRIENPSGMQSLYANGIILAIILTAVFIMKIKSVRFLFIYPAVSLVALLMVNMTRTESMCNSGAFLLGFFAAGGVLQFAKIAFRQCEALSVHALTSLRDYIAKQCYFALQLGFLERPALKNYLR